MLLQLSLQPDNWRASTARQSGAIEGNQPVSDNDWESLSTGANHDARIERWIADQMKGLTCTIVLVGEGTAKRKRIIHEIIKSWNDVLGVVGIRIHGLMNRFGETATLMKKVADGQGISSTFRSMLAST